MFISEKGLSLHHHSNKQKNKLMKTKFTIHAAPQGNSDSEIRKAKKIFKTKRLGNHYTEEVNIIFTDSNNVIRAEYISNGNSLGQEIIVDRR